MSGAHSTDGFSKMQRLSPPRQTQRGITLFVVVIFVLLSMLLVLWASRTALFNEMVVGNDVDYQRAFEAAQALVQDAELDIRGQKADGSVCSGSGDTCRASTTEKIPLETTDVIQLLAQLDQISPTQCGNALCTRRTGKQDFWNDASTLTQMKAVGAHYGRYTGAVTGSDSQSANPILAASGNDQRGWYWIEVLPYVESQGSGLIVGGATNLLQLNLNPNVVYRITALAYGRKPNTLVVLQETYARQALKD